MVRAPLARQQNAARRGSRPIDRARLTRSQLVEVVANARGHGVEVEVVVESVESADGGVVAVGGGGDGLFVFVILLRRESAVPFCVRSGVSTVISSRGGMPDEPWVVQGSAVARAAHGVQTARERGEIFRDVVRVVPEASLRRADVGVGVTRRSAREPGALEVRRVTGRVREVREAAHGVLQAAHRVRRAIDAGGERRCSALRGAETVVAGVRARPAADLALRGVVQRFDDRVNDFVHPRRGFRLDGVLDPEKRVVRAIRVRAVTRTAVERTVMPVADTVRAVETRARVVDIPGAVSSGSAPAQRRVRGHVPLDVVVRVPQAGHGEQNEKHHDRAYDHDRLLPTPAEPVVRGFLLAPHRGAVDGARSRRASERHERPRAVVWRGRRRSRRLDRLVGRRLCEGEVDVRSAQLPFGTVWREKRVLAAHARTEPSARRARSSR